MELNDNIDRIVDRNSAAYLALTAFREAAKRFLNIEKLPMVQTQDVKRHLRRMETADMNRQMNIYPYAYFNLTRMAIDKDQQAVKTLARAGMGYTFDEIENAVIKNAYLFPCIIGIELHYVTNDLIRAIDFGTRANILAATGKLNTRVELDGFSWFVTAYFPDAAVDFPRPEKDGEEDPEGFDITMNCELHTKIGVMKGVPKVGNRGAVTSGVEIIK